MNLLWAGSIVAVLVETVMCEPECPGWRIINYRHELQAARATSAAGQLISREGARL